MPILAHILHTLKLLRYVAKTTGMFKGPSLELFCIEQLIDAKCEFLIQL
jgi:hypothetical protein